MIGKPDSEKRKRNIVVQLDAKSAERSHAAGQQSLTAKFVDWRRPRVHDNRAKSLGTRGDGSRNACRPRSDDNDIRVGIPGPMRIDPFRMLDTG